MDPRKSVRATEDAAPEEFIPFRETCKPKWFHAHLEQSGEMRVSRREAHLLFSAA
jgi:hypothetical protein